MSRKVFVVNNSGHDFSTAEEFGELVYLSEGMFNSFDLNKMYRMFAELLVDSTQEDYILMSGLPQMNMIASAIFGYMHGRVNILLYSSRNNNYQFKEIVLGNLIDNNRNND